VDTTVPRSIWVHPYKDEQYLREQSQRKDRQTIRRHSSASQGIASPVIVDGSSDPQREHCVNGSEPARKKLKLAKSPESAPAPSAHDDITVRSSICTFDCTLIRFALACVARTGGPPPARFFVCGQVLPRVDNCVCCESGTEHQGTWHFGAPAERARCEAGAGADQREVERGGAGG
jgi:hypothetical protein